ncbi:hypothetical protein CROQUDRAFT_719723 [Cronartium quercuum f. sp. fusiforme G11]|uniref:Uncharacterized protein n=1 Tax=Cronartium quercuum f. sp. fusiforme G11 TaxID=708437 RepID=A0A9P6NR37_9BASI|nr:hypothetical protein CROQUDRAFT_719723 [Cronartium quercuum f. sp. fusiforme G11]
MNGTTKCKGKGLAQDPSKPINVNDLNKIADSLEAFQNGTQPPPVAAKRGRKRKDQAPQVQNEKAFDSFEAEARSAFRELLTLVSMVKNHDLDRGTGEKELIAGADRFCGFFRKGIFPLYAMPCLRILQPRDPAEPIRTSPLVGLMAYIYQVELEDCWGRNLGTGNTKFFHDKTNLGNLWESLLTAFSDGIRTYVIDTDPCSTLDTFKDSLGPGHIPFVASVMRVHETALASKISPRVPRALLESVEALCGGSQKNKDLIRSPSVIGPALLSDVISDHSDFMYAHVALQLAFTIAPLLRPAQVPGKKSLTQAETRKARTDWFKQIFPISKFGHEVADEVVPKLVEMVSKQFWSGVGAIHNRIVRNHDNKAYLIPIIRGTLNGQKLCWNEDSIPVTRTNFQLNKSTLTWCSIDILGRPSEQWGTEMNAEVENKDITRCELQMSATPQPTCGENSMTLILHLEKPPTVEGLQVPMKTNTQNILVFEISSRYDCILPRLLKTRQIQFSVVSDAASMPIEPKQKLQTKLTVKAPELDNRALSKVSINRGRMLAIEVVQPKSKAGEKISRPDSFRERALEVQKGAQSDISREEGKDSSRNVPQTHQKPISRNKNQSSPNPISTKFKPVPQPNVIAKVPTTTCTESNRSKHKSPQSCAIVRVSSSSASPPLPPRPVIKKSSTSSPLEGIIQKSPVKTREEFLTDDHHSDRPIGLENPVRKSKRAHPAVNTSVAQPQETSYQANLQQKKLPPAANPASKSVKDYTDSRKKVIEDRVRNPLAFVEPNSLPVKKRGRPRKVLPKEEAPNPENHISSADLNQENVPIAEFVESTRARRSLQRKSMYESEIEEEGSENSRNERKKVDDEIHRRSKRNPVPEEKRRIVERPKINKARSQHPISTAAETLVSDRNRARGTADSQNEKFVELDSNTDLQNRDAQPQPGLQPSKNEAVHERQTLILNRDHLVAPNLVKRALNDGSTFGSDRSSRLSTERNQVPALSENETDYDESPVAAIPIPAQQITLKTSPGKRSALRQLMDYPSSADPGFSNSNGHSSNTNGNPTTSVKAKRVRASESLRPETKSKPLQSSTRRTLKPVRELRTSSQELNRAAVHNHSPARIADPDPPSKKRRCDKDFIASPSSIRLKDIINEYADNSQHMREFETMSVDQGSDDCSSVEMYEKEMTERKNNLGFKRGGEEVDVESSEHFQMLAPSNSDEYYSDKEEKQQAKLKPSNTRHRRFESPLEETDRSKTTNRQTELSSSRLTKHFPTSLKARFVEKSEQTPNVGRRAGRKADGESSAVTWKANGESKHVESRYDTSADEEEEVEEEKELAGDEHEMMFVDQLSQANKSMKGLDVKRLLKALTTEGDNEVVAPRVPAPRAEPSLVKNGHVHYVLRDAESSKNSKKAHAMDIGVARGSKKVGLLQNRRPGGIESVLRDGEEHKQVVFSDLPDVYSGSPSLRPARRELRSEVASKVAVGLHGKSERLKNPPPETQQARGKVLSTPDQAGEPREDYGDGPEEVMTRCMNQLTKIIVESMGRKADRTKGAALETQTVLIRHTERVMNECMQQSQQVKQFVEEERRQTMKKLSPVLETVEKISRKLDGEVTWIVKDYVRHREKVKERIKSMENILEEFGI